MRLDKFLFTNNLTKSRTYAENLIKTGRVCVNGKTETKAGRDVCENDDIKIILDEEYASQGAYKLEAAFDAFSIDVSGKACADIGCSNGGFTDCLLRHGAKSVLAVDVAESQLPKKLTDTGKVTFLRANARELPPSLDKVDFVCSDVSFISLTYILDGIYGLLKQNGTAAVLIKPQFELDKSALNKNGIVKSDKYREKAVDSVKKSALDVGFSILGITNAPIRFENKNIEYLMYLQK